MLRKPWDIYESALLLDTFLLIESGNKTRRNGIEELSSSLRALGASRGLIIDEKYRNANGIAMQLNNLQYAWTNGTKGLPCSSKIFYEIVEVFRNKPLEFQSILLEAKAMTNVKTVADQFCSWLAERVSPAQLSELYQMYTLIDDFCISRSITDRPLLTIVDMKILRKVIATVEQNQVFRFMHRGQTILISKAAKYYISFIAEKGSSLVDSTSSYKTQAAKAAVKERTIVSDIIDAHIDYIDNRSKRGCLWILGGFELQTFVNKCSLEGVTFHYSKSGCHVSKGKPAWWTTDEYKIDKISATNAIESTGVVPDSQAPVTIAQQNGCVLSSKESSEATIKTVDFDEQADYSNTRPTGCSYFGILHQASSWQAVYCEILKCLSEDYDLSRLQGKTANHGERLLWGNKSHISMMKQPFPLDQDDMYADIGFGSNTIVKLIATLLRFCLVDYENVCITYIEGVSLPNNTTSEPIGNASQLSSVSQAPDATDSAIKELVTTSQDRYASILKMNFPDGFRPNKAIDRNRFRVYFSETYSEDITDNDEQLIDHLLKIGTLRNDRIFIKDEAEQKDLLNEIDDTISQTFGSGASCIYIDCLYCRFQSDLSDSLHIYDVEAFENVLLGRGNRRYYKRYNYICNSSCEANPQHDVLDYMKHHHVPVTYEEIANDLWYIPLDKIKQVLVTAIETVNAAPEAYMYAPNLPINEDELKTITIHVRSALLQRSYISDVELMQIINDHCPSVAMNTSEYPVWGLRNALSYLLRYEFSFRGAIISRKGEEISMAEVFSDFCKRNDHLTVDELKNFASELDTVIYWDSVYEEMIRINHNEFIRKDQLSFDVERIDVVLDMLISDEYVPLKSITLFLHFPPLSVSWNSFVLESYIANYSKKYELMHASFSATDCCGAIVRRDSGIPDYRSLLVEVLANNRTWKSKADALDLLVRESYQQRRSYSDIEKVMQESKAKAATIKK